ncbi:hypothetical protein Q3Y53_02755 [Synechococcus sp. YX-04-1]|uniref:hypothetical protein n=1 Tax=Synechococcus sp. YX-04-1 TaxID=3062778 RepID=UPI0026E12A91|nr:hypothetical protein [Synechococcus sp. YX-04-1]MDO6351453.1 hypothetical protein [Synechococcus sp. YX-04-1]
MHPAVRDDRIWFQNNPAAVVRFRKAIAGEFEAVANHGGGVPVFRPSFCRTKAPTRWVAVVDLMRLIETEQGDINEPTARLRLKIPALRSKNRKCLAERELKQAIAAELLASLETDNDTIAA